MEIAAELQHGIDLLTTRLRDVPERHRSLRAVFEHSWQLLSLEEQRILQRLSVFRGAFPAVAAHQITGTTRAMLAALVDKTLLRWNATGAYDMHELVRQYAAERLAATEGDEPTRDAHSRYYAVWLEEQATHITRSEQQSVLAEIDRAIENVRAGWEWAITHAHFAEIAHFIDGLWLYHDRRALYREGAAIFEHAVTALAISADISRDVEHAGIMARLLLRQAWFAQWLAQWKQACELLEHRHHVVRGSDSVREQALELLTQAEVAKRLGERAKAERYYRESLARFQGLGDRFGVALAWVGQSILLRMSGAFEEAYRLAQASLAISEASGDHSMVARALEELSTIARDWGDPTQAKQFCLRSLEIARRIGNRWGTLSALITLAANGWVYGEYEEAEQWCAEGLMLARDIGRAQDIRELTRTQAILAGLQGRHAVAEQLCRESLALAQQIGELHVVAQTVILLSWSMHGQGRHAEAHHHAREALSLFESVDDQVGLVLAHLGVGRAACALDAMQEAHACLADALRTAQAIGAVQYVPYILATCAALLWKIGSREEAVEILALILHHPESTRMARDEAAPLLTVMKAELPSDVFVVAQQRGHGRTFEALVDDFLVSDGRSGQSMMANL